MRTIKTMLGVALLVTGLATPQRGDPPPGCRFVTLCEHAADRCRRETPELRSVGKGHAVAFDFDEVVHTRMSA